ncbi:MAG: ABC transporter permease [Actinomycetota bacterium]|nr:ABC transporter permease [Actinomycetota bacterium]
MAAHPYQAQAKAEIRLSMTQYESLLVTFGIPLLFLVAFSLIKVLPLPHGVLKPVAFLVPGTIALAVMATGMVSLGIATGVERSYGVLKRLGTTPLSRGALLGAKITAVAIIELVQVVLLAAVGFALGWKPAGNALEFVLAIILSSAAFAGIGLILAGRLKSETVIGAANGLFLLLLVLGGMIFPVTSLPGPIADVARLLPAYASAHILFVSSTGGGASLAGSWIVLAVWAIVAPLLATRLFRFE